WVPNDPEAPIFANLKFNAQQSDQRWIEIRRKMMEFHALEPDMRTGSASFFFFEALGSPVARVNRNWEENLRREVQMRLRSHFNSRASSLLITVLLPQAGVRGAVGGFPVNYEIGFQSFNSDPNVAVTYRKRFTANAELVELNPKEKEKLN